MKVFYAQLNDGSTIRKKADRFEITGDAIIVWYEGEPVAYMDMGVTHYAHIHDVDGDNKGGN